MIYWIFGRNGAGKTTMAGILKQSLEVDGQSVVHLDGDDMRSVWTDLGLSPMDRWTQNVRVARLASVLEKQGHIVIVSTICPYRTQRREITEAIHPRWIYLPGGHPTDADHPFEPPD